MSNSPEEFLRRAIVLAHQSRQQGGDPFGAVLVFDNRIVHESTDRSVESSDPTFHAELSVISEYCRQQHQFRLKNFTLYTSCEPCLMCAGAIHWSGITQVVFSTSQQMLQQLSGGRRKPTLASLLNAERQRVEIIGPLLPEEGLSVFEGYTFVPKVERHHQRFHSSP